MSLSNLIIQSEPIAGVRLFSMRTKPEEAVVIIGSIPAGHIESLREKPFVAYLTALMLDEGTKKSSKRAVHEKLESLGASTVFSLDSHRVQFSVLTLKKHLKQVLEIISEELREPAFRKQNLSIVAEREATLALQLKEDTAWQARAALLRKLFPEHHPNFQYSAEETIKHLHAVSSEDLHKFHQQKYVREQILVSAAGDVEHDILENALSQTFKNMKNGSKEKIDKTQTIAEALPAEPDEIFIKIPDKANIDLFIGGSVRVGNKHRDYYPLALALFILGGDFFARLGSAVREKKGLTYGTYARLLGTDYDTGGYWCAQATLAPSLFEAGRKAVMEEIKCFCDKGVTDKELSRAKTTLTGAYHVGLASARSITATILDIAEEERPMDFIDEYTNIIKSVTKKEVNTAIARYVDLKNAVVAAAGTLDMPSK